MRVGIITILKVDNYGADLQAYALQHQLEMMGYEAEIIDYLYYRNDGYKRERYSYPRFHYPFKLKIREFLLVVRDYYMYVVFHRTTTKRKSNFQDFYKNIKFSKTFRTISELYHAKLDYDVYCVGSDQVWNPGNYTNLDPYFLTFAPQYAKKISYASSFGVSELPDYSRLYYKNTLKRLNSIGVRESDGIKIIKGLTEIEAKEVLDPTLLLIDQEWKTVEREIVELPNKYLLLYELKKNKALRVLANNIAKNLHLDIVRISGNVAATNTGLNAVDIKDAGPMEFIYAFRHATFVITNSFHGAAFSINFKKDFYVVTSKTKTNYCRFESLLRRYGLEGRLFDDADNAINPKSIEYSINYSQVSHFLEQLKAESVDYLKKAIDGKG